MDAIVEPPRMDSWRFAEVSAHPPAGQALDNNEGTTFNVPNKFQISLIENVITFIPRQ